MKAHVLKGNKIVNTILVNALTDFPDLIDATQGGIGWTYDNGVFTAPEPDPEETAKQLEAYQKAQAIEHAKTDIKKEKEAFVTEGKNLSMAYLDKRLTAIETILGV